MVSVLAVDSAGHSQGQKPFQLIQSAVGKDTSVSAVETMTLPSCLPEYCGWPLVGLGRGQRDSQQQVRTFFAHDRVPASGHLEPSARAPSASHPLYHIKSESCWKNFTPAPLQQFDFQLFPPKHGVPSVNSIAIFPSSVLLWTVPSLTVREGMRPFPQDKSTFWSLPASRGAHLGLQRGVLQKCVCWHTSGVLL